MLKSQADMQQNYNDGSKGITSKIVSVLSYFPIRYLIFAFLFSYILLSNIETIESIQIRILSTALDIIGIPSFILDGNLYVGSIYSPTKISIPLYTQTLFLMFFPTVAISSRIRLAARAKILSFGLLLFCLFIVIQFITIIIMVEIGMISFEVPYLTTIILITTSCAGLTIEAMLFSTITLPHRTKIKPIIRRSYKLEFLFMALILTGSLVVISILLNFLQITADTPFTTYVLLNMNISILMIFSYFLAMPIYSIKVPDWVKWARNGANHTFKVSFLLAAHNEEKYIKRCIESIDKAASNYGGIVEILMVNDGSTDSTSKIGSRAIESLKHCKGHLYDIQNSGKGFALRYGLEKTLGEIIFRIDADCVFDEKGINLVANHFRDPRVASVGGMILPLETESILQKTVYLKFVYFLFVVKRGQELLDSILVQAGGYSVFRKEALLKIGGAWMDNQFGEDGELTHRIARSGYKTELELRSVVYSEVPEKLTNFMHQRSRWNIAFYHSRARNLELLKEWRSPRSFVFLTDLIAHGASFGIGLTWPLVIAAVMTNNANFSITGFLGIPILNAVVIQLVIYSLQITALVFYLRRFGKLGYIKYYPFLRIVGFVLSVLVKPTVMEILLSWSSKRKKYDKESFESLRSEMKKSIDPLH